ncbi:MAG TPA: hypothetical protein VFX89_05955 [Gammaproteobacteria bacterium]|nr:hypothetical protein [Gammaproteobacteria bacterium]
MSIALAIAVLVGFAPTYYLHGSLGAANELTPALHWHGAAFTTWMLLLVTQTSLIAARRVDLHRMLGVAGAALGVCMMVLGYYVAITRMADGTFVSPPGTPRYSFLAFPLASVVVFPILFGTALWYRKRPDIHKRLVLIATMELATAALARWPVLGALGPFAFFPATDAFLAALVVYDLATLKRVHAATLWGGILLVATQPLRVLIGFTPQWDAFAGWIIS